jgi:hypothetical protein
MENTYSFEFHVRESSGTLNPTSIVIQNGLKVDDIIKSIQETGRYKDVSHRIEQGNYCNFINVFTGCGEFLFFIW